MSASDFKPDDLVSWTYTPRGGYGYSYPVDGVVVRVNPKTITICVRRKDGSEKLVRVKPESLKKRTT